MKYTDYGVIPETLEEWKQVNTECFGCTPREKCIMCKSSDINYDFEGESYTCKKCGSVGGGANFWE